MAKTSGSNLDDEMLYLLKPHDPVVLYNLACSYSLLNEKDKAPRSDSRFRKYFSRIKNGTAMAEKIYP